MLLPQFLEQADSFTTRLLYKAKTLFRFGISKCPRCHSDESWPSPPQKFTEVLLSGLGWIPYTCDECRWRYYRLIFMAPISTPLSYRVALRHPLTAILTLLGRLLGRFHR